MYCVAIPAPALEISLPTFKGGLAARFFISATSIVQMRMQRLLLSCSSFLRSSLDAKFSSPFPMTIHYARQLEQIIAVAIQTVKPFLGAIFYSCPERELLCHESTVKSSGSAGQEGGLDPNGITDST